MDSDNANMTSIIDLMWTVEEEPVDDALKDTVEINANCGGGCCVACCCSVPNIITKWICGGD